MTHAAKPETLARLDGAAGIASALGVEVDVGPWMAVALAAAEGAPPPLAEVSRLQALGVEIAADDFTRPDDLIARLALALGDHAADTAEDYHRRYRESEIVEEVAEALGVSALTLPALLDAAREAGVSAAMRDALHKELARIVGALGSPAPERVEDLAGEVEQAIVRYCRTALHRMLSQVEGQLRRESRRPDASAEDRRKFVAAVDAWRWARVHGPHTGDASSDDESTWEATPAQSMGVASAVELALLLGVEPGRIDRVLVRAGGDRARAVAALRELCDDRAGQERGDAIHAEIRDEIDAWVRRQGETLAALGPFARDPEWVGVLHRMISQMADALGNGHLPPRDLEIVAAQVASASESSLLGLRVVQAEARMLIERQRADRLEAGLRAMAAPSMTAVPWPRGAEVDDAIAMAELAATRAGALCDTLTRIAESPADILDTPDVAETVRAAARQATELYHTSSRASEILTQFVADATHARSNARPVVAG